MKENKIVMCVKSFKVNNIEINKNSIWTIDKDSYEQFGNDIKLTKDNLKIEINAPTLYFYFKPLINI